MLRHFFLRPDPTVAQIYLYCLGEAAARFDITIHAWIVMSNHHHLLFRDNRGNYPAFLAHLHKMIAKAMNVYLGRRENFWSSEQPSVVFVVESFDRLSSLLYVLANAVTANLVDRVADWPGAISLEQNLTGRVKRVKRPRVFFSEEGTMPETVELRVAPIDGFADLSAKQWEKLLMEQLAEREEHARRARREARRGVLGRKGVLATDRNARPTTEEPRRRDRPCIACKNKETRETLLDLLRAFRAAYRIALTKWRGGARRTTFPPGTYQMRWFGVPIAA